jgi:4-alpha-glucanotransferase
MRDKINLALIFHNHQPVGNFDDVFQAAYDMAYVKLVELMERHPQVKAAMHFSGSLRDWLLIHQPALYERLQVLVTRGQLEIIGGAYYEPILVMLNDADKHGQLRKLSDAIEADFGVSPAGMWLAERVWEPQLATPIAQAGLRYVIVDDTHFHYAGFGDADLYGYYLTEDQNNRVALIPASQQMRYMIPTSTVDDVMAHLRALYDTPNRPENALIVMGDDGEKFGLWPGSFAHCWENGWMDAFFDALAQARDWLKMTTPAAYTQDNPSLGRAYLPTASYIEMSQWALPAETSARFQRVRRTLDTDVIAADYKADDKNLHTIRDFLRGGFWRNFLAKYPEVNHMQKRGLYTGRRLRDRLSGELANQALDYIWAAQCNCAYWHGVFGGIYLYHIRAANYTNILNAEALLLGNTTEAEWRDFDADGLNELLINSQPFSLIIDAAHGGTIIEWDDIPSRYNLLNIITRHAEAYHETLQEAAANGNIVTPDMQDWDHPAPHQIRAKSPNLTEHIIVDQHRRGTLIDHFFPTGTAIDDFYKATYSELGDFVHKAYDATLTQQQPEAVTAHLHRDGNVNGQSLRVEKQFTVSNGDRTLRVDYTLTNTSDAPITLCYGMEAAFGLDGGDSDLCGITIDDTRGNLGHVCTHDDISGYVIDTRIRGFSIHATLSQPCIIWRFPLAPVTISEGGFERVHQGAIVLHRYDITLAPGEFYMYDITWTIEALAE